MTDCTAQPLWPVPTLRTDRLDLLPLRVEYAEEMTTVLADPALHTFTGGAPARPDALRTRYERLVTGSPDPGAIWCNWVLRLRAQACPVGTVQATITGEVAEIAWVVGTPWQGRGFAGEAARELVGALGGQPGIRTVLAHIHPDHHASAAVASSAGLTATEEEQDGEIRWRLSVRRRGRALPARARP
ncbi:GNAT family N-acetyltransferase [Streptomyces sp. NPDC058371]|uniref:GNAT family N-acetyltransferase n=1 Tax=Streptomyces sp. NPDC058371 TaxID=3346463 RepID=UPI0036665982